MADLKALAEQLVNLTVKEVNELANILKDEYGIEPFAAAVAVVCLILLPLLRLQKRIFIRRITERISMQTNLLSLRQLRRLNGLGLQEKDLVTQHQRC